MSVDRPGHRGRPRRRRWPALAVLFILLGLLAVVAGRALVPPTTLRRAPRTVDIPPQQGVVDVGQILADAGVIRSRLAFVVLAVVRGTARSLKAGEYEIPQGATLLTTLKLIEAGKVKPHLLVLPEGFTVRELARQIESEGIAPAAEVLRLASDPAFTASVGIEAKGLEGYLFPDTYQLTKGMRPDDVLGRMVHRFRERLATPDVVARAAARGLSLHELVTLASIVEKEAVVPEERPVIAGVFWNRLRRDMPLQADPTVAYAVAKAGRAPSREDLQVDHPFNTYRYRGLPPGPIANPGRASVDACLDPAEVPYLYFVSIDDRRHHFSATLPEHNAAVTRYRAGRGRSGGS